MAAPTSVLSVGIVGVSGYTGEELVRLLARHRGFRLTFAASRRHAGKLLAQVYPYLTVPKDLTVSPPDAAEAQEKAELLFLALPHKEAAGFVAQLDLEKVRVVDLSADFRLRDRQEYETTYETAHPAADLLPQAVYGLTEWCREALPQAKLVANPGCYPTCTALGLLPVLDLLDLGTPVVVDAKSGVSGAGRKLAEHLLLAEAGESFKPYGVVGHRHTPEIRQTLSLAAGQPVRVVFTPHLMNVVRGMETTTYVSVKAGVTVEAVRQRLAQAYADSAFVRLLPDGDWPDVRRVVRSNLCLLNVALDGDNGVLKVFAALDNLTKGASGQAIQNANVMTGQPETEGLL